MNEIDETIRYSVEFSKRTMDILRKMAEEDNVSLVTEIESAISGWYRMRHGFTGLTTLEPYEFENSERGIIECQNSGTNGRYRHEKR